jgi:hypothetical protein
MDPRQHKLLSALRLKYQTIRELRLQADADATIAPRAELAALAHAFPGALRELDRLPMASLEARLCALDLALCDAAEPEPWMWLQSGYHGFMRAVLRIRRLSRGRPKLIVDAASELAALAYEPADDEPPAQRFGVAELSAIRRPPGGRLNPWVLAQVAHDHGVTPELVRAALFLQ